MHTVIYKRATTSQELKGILELQKHNIPLSISEEEKLKEDFLTVHHSFEILKAMNDVCPHIIATQNNKVVGYALSMVTEFQNTIDVLKPMFLEIDTCVKPSTSYIVMGQICIDKSYRKQGLFRGLYQYMQKELNTTFNLLITEVDVKNTRSLNAHQAVGFEVLKKYTSNNQEWTLLSWDWS
ncbi:MAG: GNAT family N-acetyltransferase [Algibacter sp.]